MDQNAEMTRTFDIVGVAQRQKTRRRTKQFGKIAVGVTLIGFSIGKFNITRLVLGLCGGALLLRGLTNRTLLTNARVAYCKLLGRSSAALCEGRDIVDESSWESFPASDPPSFSQSHT